MSSRNNCQYCDYDFTSYRKKPEKKPKDTHNGCSRVFRCNSHTDVGVAKKYERSCKKECNRSRSRSHSEERQPKCKKYYSYKHYESSCSEKESKSDDSVSCRSDRSQRSERSHRSDRSEPTSQRSEPISHNRCEKYKVCKEFEEKKCTKKIDGKCGNTILITILC